MKRGSDTAVLKINLRQEKKKEKKKNKLNKYKILKTTFILQNNQSAWKRWMPETVGPDFLIDY